MASIEFSRPIPAVPTYILPAKERRMCAKFQLDNFKTERLVCVETDRRTDGHAYIDSGGDPDQEYKLIIFKFVCGFYKEYLLIICFTQAR